MISLFIICDRKALYIILHFTTIHFISFIIISLSFSVKSFFGKYVYMYTSESETTDKWTRSEASQRINQQEWHKYLKRTYYPTFVLNLTELIKTNYCI